MGALHNDKTCFIVFTHKSVLDSLWKEDLDHGQKAVRVGNNRVTYNPSSHGDSWSSYPNKRTVFVGHLDREMTAQDLWFIFKDYKPTGARICRDKEGNSKCVGF